VTLLFAVVKALLYAALTKLPTNERSHSSNINISRTSHARLCKQTWKQSLQHCVQNTVSVIHKGSWALCSITHHGVTR